MKNIIEYISKGPRMILGLLLLCNTLTAYGQFQATVGAAYPSDEKCPGGIITPSGDFLVPGTSLDLFNPIGDWQLHHLDQSGNLLSPSHKLGNMVVETAAWIEHAVCDPIGANRYIVAGHDQDEMLLSAVDPTGTPIWIRQIGSTNNLEESACLKIDFTGFIILVGTQYDFTNGGQSIVATRVSCLNGVQQWNRVYSNFNYQFTVRSVTAFAVTGGAQDSYYITGKATPVAGGNEQVFMMKLDANTGNFGFLKLYDIAPNSDDVATCIQGSLAPAPNGGIWLSGYSHDVNGLKNVLMMKTNLNGTPQWAKNFDVDAGDEFANHFELSNGQLVLTGRAEEYKPFQGTNAGNAMLMRMDIFGNTVDWTRVYTGNGFSSQGNRVGVTANGEYFISGNTLELISPSQSASNILAIKTDQLGRTDPTCYHDTSTLIIPRTPTEISFGPASMTLGQLPNFLPITLNKLNYNDQISYCPTPPPPCDCDFTWTNTTCFNGYFTVNCNPAYGGSYTYIWDYDCGGPMPPEPPVFVTNNNPNGVPFSHTFPHAFPCGGGTFTVCLKIIDPNGIVCNIIQTVTVPNTCCGSVTGNLECHPTDPYKYNFTINVTNPLGSTNCSHVLTSAYQLSNLIYTPTTITGCIVIPDPIPTTAGFTLQTNCTCPASGLPFTCTLPFTLPTVCCKQICVDNQTVCNGLDEFLVPFYPCNWPPLNKVYQVSWYVMPKPPSGICPTFPWGGPPYQSTVVSGNLEPLLLFPNSLPGDLCIYVVIDLNDGPCTQITSNIAMVELCNPNGCTLDNQEFCYTGTCINPAPLTITSTGVTPTCFPTVEWFDQGGNSVQIGGSTYQPPCLSMSNDQNCYEDFIYTAVITDDCGTHECKATIRLYSGNASVGTLALTPPDVSPVCWAEDATLKFTPNCAGDPALWAWYERDCIGNVSILSTAGLMNNCLNLNELHNDTWYGVGAMNGVCPINEEILVEVIKPAVIFDFTAQADACAQTQVVLSASVTPGTKGCLNLPFPCTYTYEWYKDGFLIGTTSNGTASETFTYLNPLPLPSTVAGNYSVIIREDCCPRNIITSWVIPIPVSCDQCIIGPCFICDNKSETFSVIMVQPPNKPCPDFCTFTWYDAILVGNNWVMNNPIGTGSSVTISAGGHYFLESDCNGCIKKNQFDVLACNSGQLAGQAGCGPVSVEELMQKDESPLRVFPNPTTGEITVEWTGNAPKNARIFITDQMGRRLRMLSVPESANSLSTAIDDLPSGLYFVKVQSTDRLFTVAKLVKE
jgi:hypothetical protein